MSSLAGREILGYKIHALIGRGGMGEVYRATHVKTGRNIAIKLLIHERGIDRFRNEARLQANVEHPNIARLYDLVEIEGRPALIIEFVEGPDLDEYLRQNPLLSTQAKLAIFQQIVTAIAHLHKLSITHRDIKPSNIKVQPNGHVKLIDFGIAKGVSSPTITASGQTVGTLDYMSPERLNGRHTVQSDIWSLGVMLYEMIMDKHPFRAEDDFTTRKAISKGEYVRIEKFPNLPVSDQKIGGIIQKCLQANPDRRFKDGSELLEAVNRFMRYGSRLSMSRTVPSLMRKGNTRRIAIGVLVLTALVVTGFLLVGDGSKKQDASQTHSVINPGTTSPAGADQIELVIRTNTASPAIITLPDGSRCPAPCTLKRPDGTEIDIEITAEGYRTYTTRLQFLKNDSKTFTLRRQ